MAQRTAGANRPNSGLQHITVLEEAHNLLRRTSTEQSQESSNLQGKSVEMLTNAIAEMRTYGEGFLIADQSPGLLDMAVIRNTNTKLILRLPDEGDRLLVGKAAGLNDDQIVELSRLDTGVAAVYQNHWLEPVLCKVEHFKGEKPYEYVFLGPFLVLEFCFCTVKNRRLSTNLHAQSHVWGGQGEEEVQQKQRGKAAAEQKLRETEGREVLESKDHNL